MTIGKIFNQSTLLIANILIITFVEMTGTFFASTGLIHLLAIIFVFLALIRAFAHIHVHDRFLEPIIHRGIVAMFILAISHIVEYVSYMIFYLPKPVFSFNVVNFYLASTLIVASAIEIFIGKLDKFYLNLAVIFEIVSALFFFLIIIILVNQNIVEKIPSLWMVIPYLIAIIFIQSLIYFRLQILKKTVPIMTNFIRYFTAAFILIGISALLYTLEAFLTNIGIPYLQIIYFSHFFFFGALSLVFLAYDHFVNLGGLYDDLEKMGLNK